MMLYGGTKCRRILTAIESTSTVVRTEYPAATSTTIMTVTTASYVFQKRALAPKPAPKLHGRAADAAQVDAEAQQIMAGNSSNSSPFSSACSCADLGPYYMTTSTVTAYIVVSCVYPLSCLIFLNCHRPRRYRHTLFKKLRRTALQFFKL